MILKKYILILLGLVFFSTSINSQEKKITIKVIDVNNKPVGGAIILFDFEKQKIWTNSNGVFMTKLKSEPNEISAFHPNIGIEKIKYNGENNVIIMIKERNDFNQLVKSPKQKITDSDQFNTIYDYLRGKTPGELRACRHESGGIRRDDEASQRDLCGYVLSSPGPIVG